MVQRLNMLAMCAGWAYTYMGPAVVVRIARCIGTPVPMHAVTDYPARSAYACWGTGDEAAWECVEERVAYFIA